MLSSLLAVITLGAPFSDGAVLQRGRKLPIWGTAGAGNVVEVSFAGKKASAKVGDDCRWRVDFPALEACAEGRKLVISETDGTRMVARREVGDVLVGEVWFASGQSNMECPIWGGNARYRDAKGGLMTTMTHLPFVRYVKIGRAWSTHPVDRIVKWSKFTREDLQMFHRVNTRLGGPNTGVSLSAVAFYYARELHLALGIPVGIVDASWGGTNIDAWTPRCGYENCDPSIRATAEYPVVEEKEWKPFKDWNPICSAKQQPTVLFNGMVAAFAPMSMRGFIWYQGCHNSSEPQTYAAKMHALYDGWAKAFENRDLKLYFVELAPYSTSWLELCAAQERFASEEENAALAVTSDVGNFDDIHPNDKEIVAKRLAVHALKRDYGFDIPEDDSPRFKSVKFDGDRAELAFDHVKDWYVYAPDRSRAAAFEVAGTNGVWEAAKIVNFRQEKQRDGKASDTDYIDGSTIVVSSGKVPSPVKVRYLGRNRTAGTMYNEASLPLGAFESK